MLKKQRVLVLSESLAMNRYYLLGTLAYGLSWLLGKTLKIRIFKGSKYQSNKPYLFAFWHGKQFLLMLTFNQHQTPKAVLVSPSKDGDILSTWAKKMGYSVVRGSSRRDNTAGLLGMIRLLKKNYSMGFGIDGPLGPIYKVKPGMTHLAQKLGIEIVPIGIAFDRKWVFHKAWDKFELPKPFSRAVCFLGDPIFVSESEDLTQTNLNLEQKIHEAVKSAESKLQQK